VVGLWGRLAEPGRVPALDGLRAIAIILVMLRHGFREWNGDVVSGAWLSNFALNGWVGVDLFFVLSGFFMGSHFFRNWPSADEKLMFAGRYWLKRALRTLPLYYVVIFLIIAGLFPFYKFESYDFGYEMYVHAFFLQDYLGSRYLVALWSLATEEKFYFISPFLIFLVFGVNERLRLFVLFLLVFVPVCFRLMVLDAFSPDGYSSYFWQVRAPFHMALDGLLVGLFVAAVCNYVSLNKVGFTRHGQLLMLALLIILALLVSKPWMMDGDWYGAAWFTLGVSWLFGVVVYLALDIKGAALRVLSNDLLIVISRLSYALYLVHMLVLPLASKVVDLTAADSSFGVIGFSVVYVSLSFVIALLLHQVVERPFLKLKARIA